MMYLRKSIEAGPGRLRPIMATLLIAYLVFAVNSYTYFFLGPVIAEILIAACLGLAIVTAKSSTAAYAEAAPPLS
jgi:hypothetical protein